MKKILAFLLVSMFLISAFSTIAFAAAPQVSDFVAGNGFFVYASGSKGDRDVPTLAQGANGVSVSHGGYYDTGADFGGILSAQKVDLNGFSVTVQFDTIPSFTGDDCWIAFDFLIAQRGFYTDKFTEETGNQGMMHLIRYGSGTVQTMDGITDFALKHSVVNEFFKFKDGDVVTLIVNRTALGNYTYTFKKAGVANPVVIDYEYPMDALFPDGKAYFCLSASSKKSSADGFNYTITDMTNGAVMTQADRDAIEAAKLLENADAILVEANTRITAAETTINKAIARAEACGSQEALTKANAAMTKLGEAKAAVASGTFTIADIKIICSDALGLASDANKISKEAENAATETEAVTEKATEAATEATTEPAAAEKGGFPVWAIALIAGGAVVIVAVVLVIIRKKK